MSPIATKIYLVSSGNIDTIIAEAVGVLHAGGLVAFPTETVYGLGADAFNAEAVKNVFEAKGRPSDNPLIVHIADIHQFDDIGKNISSDARKLAETFWPGPLTLVVEHDGKIPDIVTAGLQTVAVRVPNHSVTLQLIKAFGRGIVGPSANLSGKPSPTTAQHVYNDLNGSVAIILDAGPTIIGVESTVLDMTTGPPTILRLGCLAREEIERIVGTIQVSSSDEALKRSPGTRHRHYAPRAQVEIIDEGNHEQFTKRIESYRQQGKKVGCIVHSLVFPHTPQSSVRLVKKEEYAQHLFDSLLQVDDMNVDVILVECIPDVGIGEAVMDRLRKAAEKMKKSR